jgi:serine phosphatase RsbU (regulator of sigma subunit)
VGTQKLREGDFSHVIKPGSRDQLGDLASSFNLMSRGIQQLMREQAEKERLEEELRIARQIQMSLLPGEGLVSVPGIRIAALCLPAAEVGGDYYDLLPLSDTRMGVLIADVSGKGTSAALYMAELKGVVLSLAKIYQSPRQLLIEVNRIISDNLDSRSFITMTYAVVDLERHSVTYARAGHTPLIHCSARDGGRARVLIPDGLVLGLRIDGVEEKFAQLLEECTLPLHPGDVLVLYTDGISEAMDPDGDLFGDARLQQLVEQHAHLPSDQLRERILREVQAFVGPADQHDDMTMILLKVEDMVADQVSAAA